MLDTQAFYNPASFDIGFTLRKKEINQFLAIEDVEQELYKANSSPKDRDKDFQLNRETMKELLEKFNEDLAKLDELTGLKTIHWLEKY